MGNPAKRARRGSADASAATKALVGEPARECSILIIRRSWVRSPPAPQFEISFWPASILNDLNSYIEHIALPLSALANEINPVLRFRACRACRSRAGRQ